MPAATQKLMLISIGPVQEFIAQARRTRDLWYGSHLLSELSIAGARAFQKEQGELVFPYLPQDEFDRTKAIAAPNKLMGIIRTEEPHRIARSVRFAITNRWRDIAEEIRKVVDPYIQLGIWNRQVHETVEFYAAWVQLDGIEDSEEYRQWNAENKTGYGFAVLQVERILAARKLLRDFKQDDPGELYGVRKSSLDAGRESVWRKGVSLPHAKLGIKAGESLDAISVVKRMSLKLIENKHMGKSYFPSVCETAFFPYRFKIEQSSCLREKVDEYIQRVNNILLSEQTAGSSVATYKDAMLFYERRVGDYLLEHAPNVSEEKRELLEKLIIEELEKLYRKVVRPTPYYAFLLADGDHMGRQLRYIGNKEKHIRFSQALSEFADSAKKILCKNNGHLVYSGGDDVMAYVPVDRCLETVDQLRAEFLSKMHKAVPEYSELAPTLSVGIVIAHMLEPLEEVREMAKEAEKQAKKIRDALAIHFYRRSGGDAMKVTLPFAKNPIFQLKRISCWLKKSYFSKQFAFGLRELYQLYDELNQEREQPVPTKQLADLLWMEVARLARKKKPDNVSEEDINLWLEQQLRPLYDSGEEPLVALKHLAEQFIIALQLKEVKGDYEEETSHSTA